MIDYRPEDQISSQETRKRGHEPLRSWDPGYVMIHALNREQSGRCQKVENPQHLRVSYISFFVSFLLFYFRFVAFIVN